jgi:gliding motility-associated protein GldM
MGGGKLPPRQKMIGMMYLVLTALLAMNISKDILNAFVMINESLEKTNNTFSAKNDVAYAAFDKAYSENKEKVGPYYKKAQEVRTLSKELIGYIDELKFKLIRETDKTEANIPDDSLSLMKVNAKDNYDVPTNILIGSEPASPKDGPFSAKELREKIDSYRDKILSLLDEKTRPGMKIGLVLEGGSENGVAKSWEVLNFDHTPLAATITILTKLQTDVRNAESDVVKALFSSVDAGDFKFDAITARVIAPTSYVLLGEEYQADVFVAAYSTTQDPEILIGDVDTVTNKLRGNGTPVKVEGGVGRYTIKPTSEGLQKWGGIINLKGPDGSIKPYSFKAEYMVAKAGVVVSPTKMNVLYIGVENPLDISVAGVPAENIEPVLNGGTLSKVGAGKYIAKVQGGTKATVNVAANFGKDKKQMGSMEFRVKRVPDPVAKFGGKTGSANINKSDLTTALGVFAEMENFDFDLRFDVISFDITTTQGQFEVTKTSNNNKLTEEQKGLLKNVKAGQKVYVENVKVKGPDGSIRQISPVNLKVL